jgi:hypothetical protein
MVPLATTRSAFEAQVLGARLGSEGILWQLRGGSADAMYPVGAVDVLVAADDLERAHEILQVGDDDWLDAEDANEHDAAPSRDHIELWMAAVVLALIVLFVGLRIFSL